MFNDILFNLCVTLSNQLCTALDVQWKVETQTDGGGGRREVGGANLTFQIACNPIKEQRKTKFHFSKLLTAFHFDC